MISITFLQLTYAITDFYFCTLYDKDLNEVKLACFINNELRDTIQIKAEIDNMSNKSLEMKFDKLTDTDNIIKEINSKIGRLPFDDTLFDLYCTEKVDTPFESGNMVLSFESKIGDHNFMKKTGRWFFNSFGFSMLKEDWFYFIKSYNLLKKIKDDFNNYLVNIQSKDKDNMLKDLREEVKTVINNIDNELKKIHDWSEEYKIVCEKDQEYTQEFLSPVFDIENSVKIFNEKSLNLKYKIEELIKIDDVKEEEIKTVNNKDMDRLIGIDASTFVIGLSISCLALGVAVLVHLF